MRAELHQGCFLSPIRYITFMHRDFRLSQAVKISGLVASGSSLCFWWCGSCGFISRCPPAHCGVVCRQARSSRNESCQVRVSGHASQLEKDGRPLWVIYGHEVWVVTERMRSLIQASPEGLDSPLGLDFSLRFMNMLVNEQMRACICFWQKCENIHLFYYYMKNTFLLFQAQNNLVDFSLIA